MSSALQQARLSRTRVDFTAVTWQADTDLPYDEWLRQGSRLGVAGRGAAWWIGDWLRYGTTRYGAKYSAAARITGYDRQTLMNMVYVANRFEFSRRRENLSWSHHAELAALEPDDQEAWLARIEADRLTVRDLRDELALNPKSPGRRLSAAAEVPRRGRAPQSRPLTRSEPADAERVVVCPHCGGTVPLETS